MFLFPSLTETFGNVTLEAMASGLAVVAYDYAAAREHVRSGTMDCSPVSISLRPGCRSHVSISCDSRTGCGAMRARAVSTAAAVAWSWYSGEFETYLLGIVK